MNLNFYYSLLIKHGQYIAHRYSKKKKELHKIDIFAFCPKKRGAKNEDRMVDSLILINLDMSIIT